ncbi:MAG: adenylate/guanylate cyclase domain-containing protein, partial [Bacteroidota bacterium]
MQPLIPPFIQQCLLTEKYTGQLDAFALNIDLSGFTPLTESLMKEGLVGAERLSKILNEVFEPLVKLMYDRGGFIPYFAGDAFTAVFMLPLDQKHAVHLLETADLARHIFDKRDHQFGGHYKIGLKAGLAAGPVKYGIVGDALKSYYFRGKAINQAAFCQMQAEDEEIVIDDLTRTLLEGSPAICEEVAFGAYRFIAELPERIEHLTVEPVKIGALDPEIAQQFLPAEVIRYDQPGEFRTVVSTFLSFEAVNSHEELDQFASVVLSQLNDFGGYFKEVDYG